eukprot:9608156-Alexandrium_andersonii.AAC.1
MTGWRTVECAREGKRARQRGRPRRARRASPPAEPGPQRGRGARTPARPARCQRGARSRSRPLPSSEQVRPPRRALRKGGRRPA